MSLHLLNWRKMCNVSDQIQKKKYKKLAILAYVLQNTQNLVISPAMLFCKGRLRNVQTSSRRCRCASRAQFLVTNALMWTVKSPTCPVQLAIFFCHSDHMKKTKSDNWIFFILRTLLANIKLSQPVTAVYCVPKQRRLHWYDVLNALVNWSIFKI